MNLIKRIDEMIEERSLLKHPFYQMWSDGKLNLDSLAGYSKEYFQLVKAVPSFMTPIIEKAPNHVINELINNQQEESDHIKSWIKFSGELRVSENELINYKGLEKTRKSVMDLSELMSTYEGGACAMYAFEKEIPKVSKTKLEGVKEFYGIDSKDAIEYFEEHMTADIIHAASWQKIINNTSIDDSIMLSTAEKSISAQNLLLDSCYESYC